MQHEIAKLLPHATVTTAASLASEVTGSVANAAKLANDLGKWLAILVLIAAFAVASLLTMSAVARRVAEFGTLKAIGWRTRRIVAQVLGESVVMGVIGAALGVGLGFAGAAIISKVAPKLSANVPTSSGGFTQSQTAVGPGGVTHGIESRLGDARRGRPVASVHHWERDRAGGDPGPGGRAAGRARSGAGGSPGCGPSTPSLRLRDSDQQDLSRTGEDPCTS